jgi:hypothetical protein
MYGTPLTLKIEKFPINVPGLTLRDISFLLWGQTQNILKVCKKRRNKKTSGRFAQLKRKTKTYA